MNRVLILGDILADVDVCSGRSNIHPGGAGLVAWHAARLGAETTLATCLGSHKESAEVVRRLEEVGVEVVEALPRVDRIPIRRRVHRNGSFELERRGAWSHHYLPSDRAHVKVPCDVGAIVLSDYGGLSHWNYDWERLAGHHILHDPHRGYTGSLPFRPQVVTPSGDDLGISLSAVLEAPETVMRATLDSMASASLALTFGARGLFYLATDDAVPRYLWNAPATTRDHSGTGDLFLATLASSRRLDKYDRLCDAVNLTAVSLLATKSARPGLSSCDCRARTTASRNKKDPRVPGVAVAGCFDRLHEGHEALFRRAALLGRSVTAILDSDDRVRRTKGPGRPHVPAVQRADRILTTGLADHVRLLEDGESLEEALSPDDIRLVLKGSEYSVGFSEWHARTGPWHALAVESFSTVRTSDRNPPDV